MIEIILTYLADISFLIILATCLLGCIFAFKHSRKMNTKLDVHITSHFDDYFPIPRKLKISSVPEEEEGYHKKLNYQFLIEKMTRKMYLLFILIILFSTSFIYVLYRTSLSERIAPDTDVMDQYEVMLDKVMEVEDKLEFSQLKTLAQLDSVSRMQMRKEIKQKTIEYEDELIAEISKEFFDIYFIRYVFVRLFVAGVMFALMRYLIQLYYKIRGDRNDLIRKEEALSTLFYLLDEIEGRGKDGIKKYSLLADKIPEFPLLKLFENTSNEKNKKDRIDMKELVGGLNASMSMQREILLSIQSIHRQNRKDNIRNSNEE